MIIVKCKRCRLEDTPHNPLGEDGYCAHCACDISNMKRAAMNQQSEADRLRELAEQVKSVGQTYVDKAKECLQHEDLLGARVNTAIAEGYLEALSRIKQTMLARGMIAWV